MNEAILAGHGVAVPQETTPVAPRVAHLLDIARAAFETEGFDRVSIDAIARQAGVSKETIYRHFPDKQALFRASLDEMGGRFLARAQALQSAGLPKDKTLDGLALAILDSAVSGGLLTPLWLAAGLGQRMPDFAAELQKAQAERMEPVRLAIEAIARVQDAQRVVPIEDALDFGSLAVEGSVLLMGFDSPAPDRRAAIAGRVAGLFEKGIFGMAMEPTMMDEAPAAVSISHAPLAQPPHLRRLLDTASLHFLRDGYEIASLSAIGAEAKVGRGTLYRHFGHKAGLFDAVLRDLAAQLARDAVPPALAPHEGVEAVAGYFSSATVHLTGPASIALHRAVITASRRAPELARKVHDMVREPWIGPLATWISQATKHPDTRWLARQGIVLAMHGNRAIAAGHGPAPAARPNHALRTARLFLNGLAGSGRTLP